MKRSTAIRTDFTKIPIPIENVTSPFLYSFLRGLKNVRTKRGKDKRSIMYLLSEMKKVMSPITASTYQNFRRKKGYSNIPIHFSKFRLLLKINQAQTMDDASK